MKRWTISVLLAIFLSAPIVARATDDQFDPGRTSLFNLPFLKIPIGASPDSPDTKEKKEEGPVKSDAAKEKEKQDKKVDDAIKRAWEER